MFDQLTEDAKAFLAELRQLAIQLDQAIALAKLSAAGDG